MAFFWWLWFGRRPSRATDREYIIAGVILSIVTLVIARALALSLPFRERARYIAALHFRLPAASTDFHLIHWSSFPIDILGGALWGIGVTSLSANDAVRSSLARLPLCWMRSSPGSFYVCFYAATLLLVTEVEPLREVLVAGWHMAHGSVPELP